MVTKKWSEILRSTDMKSQKFPKVTREPGTVYLNPHFWQKITRNRDLETREKCKNWKKMA